MSRAILVIGAGLAGLSVLVRCRGWLIRNHAEADKVFIFDTDLLSVPNLRRYPNLSGMRPGKLKSVLARQYLLDAGYSGTVLSCKISYSPDLLHDPGAFGDDLVVIDCSDNGDLKKTHLSGGSIPRIVTGLNKEEYWAAYLPPGCTLDVPLMDRVAARPSCGDQQANARHLMAAMRLGAAVKSLLKTLPKKPMLIAGGGNGD